ncbi:pyridoxal phosphate-dependent transferase [Fusarium oxysporum]|nr:pyridoxal phosphate-dependent transferase [Fusarium oxysporum]
MSQQVQNGASLLRILPVSDMLTRGEKESIIEKTHLISARVFRQKASKHGINFLDMGTDYHYPFYDAYPPTKAALLALKKNDITVLHYPSSFGLQSLRQAFQTFMYSRFSVTLDCMDEIMINTGASQAFDALSRAFKGRYVILPQLALPTVGVIACGNGTELLRIEPDANGGIIDLSVAQNKVDEILPSGIRFLYLNSPVNPTGSIATRDQLCMLVDFAKKTTSSLSMIWTRGAMDCCVTVLSVSKEFGLPGLRVGFIAGNSRVINTARAHNSTFSVMIPEVCQLAAQAALESFCKGGKARNEIDNHIAQVLKATIKGWTSLGWPQRKIYPPSAGFKYLVSVPPNIKGQGAFSSIELFDFFVTSRASVKLPTSRSFDPGNSGFVRIVLMQNPKEVFEFFRRLASIGVSYTMVLPDGLEHEYESFLEENVNDDF